MGKLSDILADSGGDDIRHLWNDTAAADDFAPLPPGEYIARIIAGELTTSRNSTPGYKLTFKVLEGEHAGRFIFHDVWLTAAALPMAKRDLAKLGIKSLEQLELPLPQGIRCRCHVALRREDDGSKRNRLRRFEVLGIDTPTPDPFAPVDDDQGDGFASGEPAGADATFDPDSLTEDEDGEPAAGGAA